MKKIMVLLLSVLMIFGTVSGLTGCRTDDDKGRVYYLNPNPEANDTWQALATQYTEQTGVEVRVVTSAAGTYDKALGAALTGTNAPTLFQCSNAQDLEKWNAYCLDLSETAVLKEMISTDLNLADEHGAVKAIGYSYEAFGIIVNKALLQQAGYEPAQITDFASLKAVAEDIHARSEELGFDAFVSDRLNSGTWIYSGVLANAPSYYQLANMPLYYEFRDDQITEPPATIKGTYLEAYRNIWDLIIQNSSAAVPASAEVDAETGLDDFGSGKAVFWQQGTWVYPNLVGETYQMKPKDLQMIPIYCGVDGEEDAALCCGTQNHWAVNANASDADIQATLDFLYWVVTSKAGTVAMSEQFGSIPFQAAAESENVFFADAAGMIDEGKYIVTWMFQYAPDAEQWRLGLASALTDYAAGNGQWSAVERAVIDGWAAQYEQQAQ